MAAFSRLLGMLADVPDPRRTQEQLYKLPHMLLFSIVALVCGLLLVSRHYHVHRRRLNAAFGLSWRHAPAYTAIRYIPQGRDLAVVEGTSTAMPRCCRQRAPYPDKAALLQTLLAELGVTGGILVTLDALHCQRNISKSLRQPTSPWS